MFIFFRNKYTKRFTITLLLVCMMNGLFPLRSFGFADNPHQPEYTSYEQPGASDMVNLLTGDFSYSLPILTVPNGSEVGFTIPISYQAGIGLDQEASWVGLGWNLNVGSLVRTINSYPDDANNEIQRITVQDLSGIRGWNASFLGTNLGWNSQVGHYGVINLGFKVGYQGKSVSSVGLAGLSLSGGEMKFDATEFAVAVIQAATTALTANPGAGAGLDMAVGITSQLVMDAITPRSTPNAGSSGNWKYTKYEEDKNFRTNYKIILDQTRAEQMYGVLNLHGANLADHTAFNGLNLSQSANGIVKSVKRFAPTANYPLETYPQGAASDINIDFTTLDYYNNDSPALLATDDYKVNAPGITGTIKPYRMEMGSVSVPREMADAHFRLCPVPYLDYGTSKVPFIYEGAQGEGYYYHVGGQTSVSDPYSMNFGMATSYSSSNSTTNFSLTDVVFGESRIDPRLAAYKSIPQGNAIQWLSNEEIVASVDNGNSGSFGSQKYIDYHSGNDRLLFRSKYQFPGRQRYVNTSSIAAGQIAIGKDARLFKVGDKVDVIVSYYDPESKWSTVAYFTEKSISAVGQNTITVPVGNWSNNTGMKVEVYSYFQKKQDQGIGAFVITSSDGMSYHFSLPVYDYNLRSSSVKVSDTNQSSKIERLDPFANTWLLTAVTGPDFVDRGPNGISNGIVDSNDWGYWIKFNYGRYTGTYTWQIPSQQSYRNDEKDEYKNVASGKCERYYLNSVETKSHVALFMKATRTDGLDASAVKGALRLDEIGLVTKETYARMVAAGLSDHLGKTDVILSKAEMPTSAQTILDASAIKKVAFTYDYSLCPGSTNSTTGKLTLNRIAFIGKNNAKIFPDFKLEYNATNPAYDPNKWDGWGMYNPTGATSGTTHTASPNGNDGSVWSLKAITTPEGVKIKVDYERDSYSSISGISVTNSGISAVLPANTFSGQPTFSAVQVSGTPNFSVGDIVYLQGSFSYTNCNAERITKAISGNFKITSIANGNVSLDNNYFVIPECLTSGNYQAVLTATLAKVIDKKGGNVRVASITMEDPAGYSSKIRYLYTNQDGSSSGAVSQEPEYIRGNLRYPFYDYLGYPTTGVIYSRVSVLSGTLSTDTDFYNKQVFEFETPSQSLYTISKSYPKYQELQNGNNYVTLSQSRIEDRTSRIGKLRSKTSFDRNGVTIAKQEFFYSDRVSLDNSHFGLMSEGTLRVEGVNMPTGMLYKGVRSLRLQYPYVLKSTVYEIDGVKFTDTNLNWDKFTGLPILIKNSSSFGIATLIELVPAYSVYPELGPIAFSRANKNMLSQLAARYEYKVNESDTPVGLISASATTWKKDWENYRVTGSGSFLDSPDLDSNGDGVVSADEAKRQVWRKFENFEWTGAVNRINDDGTHVFITSDKFNFISASANSTAWRKLSTQKRYSHNSQLLEIVDKEGFFASNKYGYNGNLLMAQASNARYTEIAYSGVEEPLQGNYLNDEISKGDGNIVSTNAHSGKYSIQVSSGRSMIFNSKGLEKNRIHKASVWCNSLSGRIYYKINGGLEITSTVPQEQKLINGWYLVDLEIPAQMQQFDLEVGVKSATGASVLFDDFRFLPRDASLTTFVYDPVDYKLLFILDNQNLYTMFEYTDQGVLIRTKVESLKAKKLITVGEYASNYRRFSID